MSADISSLTNLQSTEPLDWDKYADTKESFQIPRKGRYQLQAPPSFTFLPSAAGFLQGQVDPTVVGPSDAGYKLWQRVSAKPFKRAGATVSQMGDYLRAVFGTAAPRPSTPQEQADAVEATANRIFQADCDWEAYCSACKFTLKGEANFPSDGKGGHAPAVACPNCKQTNEQGVETPLTLRAKLRIDRFVSAAS